MLLVLLLVLMVDLTGWVSDTDKTNRLRNRGQAFHLPCVISIGLDCWLPISAFAEEVKHTVAIIVMRSQNSVCCVMDPKSKPTKKVSNMSWLCRILDVSMKTVWYHKVLRQGHNDSCTVGFLFPPVSSREAEPSCCYCCCFCCSCGVFIGPVTLLIMPSLSLFFSSPLSSLWHSATKTGLLRSMTPGWFLR